MQCPKRCPKGIRWDGDRLDGWHLAQVQLPAIKQLICKAITMLVPNYLLHLGENFC